MKITVRNIAGEVIYTVNKADYKTPKDVITDIEKIYEDMRLLSMTLINSSGEIIHGERYSTAFSDQEREAFIELTLVSNNKRICYIEDMERFFRNIIQNLDLDKCRNHEETMHKIVSNVSSDNIVFPEVNILEQFAMMNRKPSVWLKFDHCAVGNGKLRSIVNLIKNFTMTEETATLMVSKLLDVAVFNIVGKVIIELCSHKYVIIEPEPDTNHENDTVNQPLYEKTFRYFVVNEIQNRFEFLLGHISQAPLKMLSLIIVISRLFSGVFISRITLAKICADLFDRQNDSNRTFIISYFNIIIEICTPTLLRTDDGELLREEIFVVKNTLIAAARENRKKERKKAEGKKIQKK